MTRISYKHKPWTMFAGTVTVACLSAIHAGCGKPSQDYIIQAHRGAGDLAPENTCEAFELGWQLGTIPEADVRTSKDKVLVAFHDATFERLVKRVPPELKKKGAGDLAWAELAKLDVGAYKGQAYAGQGIPRLDHIFAIMRKDNSRRLYLDIKDADPAQLTELIQRYELDKRVIIASKDAQYLRDYRKRVPDGQTLLWMFGTEDKLKRQLDDLRAGDYEGLTQIQIHVTAGPVTAAELFDPPSSFLKTVAAELKQRGIIFQVFVKGNREIRTYVRLLDLGIHSFATDEPRVTLAAIKEHERKAVKQGENGRGE